MSATELVQRRIAEGGPLATPPPTRPAVEVHDLGKRYRSHWALKDVGFAVAPGEMLAIVGADGAGKTTLIQLLAGLLEPSAGSATVAGLDVASSDTALGERIGYMSEGFTLYGSLTVAENLAFFADLYGIAGAERDSRTADLLRFSRLDAALHRRASQLSGGMQKKLALCCVLIHQPDVLLLDEPTVGVDPLSRQEFWRLLERFLVGGVAIVMTTAYLDEAERCQQVVLLDAGRVLASGRPEELRRDAQHSEQRTMARLEDVFIAHVAGTGPASASVPVPVSHDRNSLAESGITATGITKRFGPLTVLNDVNLEVRPGEVFGLVGPNGSGKSTLIRILTGLLQPTSGRAAVAGHPVGGSRGTVQQLLGYMSQRFSLYLDMSVQENIRFYGGIYGLAGARLGDRELWALSLAGLPDGTPRTSSLGGGQRQRLALGVALLHDPRVLFLDEPTSGVDPLARRRFWDLIYAVAQSGTAVLVSTHYLDEAERCDRVGLLDAGRLVAVGTPSELKAQATAGLGGRFYSAETDRPVFALELLAKAPAVASASVYGDTVRFVLAPGADVDAVSQMLGTAGLRAGMVPAEATLEDAFVLLLQKERTP